MTSFNRIVLTSLLSSSVVMGVYAQSSSDWVDITSAVIQNPDFAAGNANGWTYWNDNCNNIGFQWASYNNGNVSVSQFIEVWRPTSAGALGNGEMSQRVDLPKGKFRLQADAIATWQNSNSVKVNGAYLFARTEAGQTFTTSLYTNNGAPQHFSVEFDVASASPITLGVLVQNTNANWVAADNFRLEIAASDIVLVTSAQFDRTSLKLSPMDSYPLKVSCTPENAFVGGFTYSSSNAAVASVDAQGVVSAKAVGQATIMARNVLSGAEARCTVMVGEAPAYVPNALVINEIQASNVDCVLDPSFNYGSWIELYNPTDEDCGLGGLYISDDVNDLKKFRLSKYMGAVPAHGYRNIWFDHYGTWNFGELRQVDFKLDYEGGTIVLSDGTSILLQQSYPQLPGRSSYARTVDGGDAWAVSSTPTPQASNAAMTFITEQVPAPEVDTDGKMFDGALSIRVGIPAGTTLRFTTDGSLPTEENGQVSHSGVFNVSASTSYRFRLFKTGCMPSEVVTRTYIKENRGLDVIALTVDDKSLHGATGLFDKSENGRAGNGQDERCNWNMEWDRPVNFEFMTQAGDYALSQEVDMAMCGGWSRAWEPHSFKLKAAKYYQGMNYLPYAFFDAKPNLKHKTLQIRNGGNSGLLKDASLQEVVRRSGLNIETQAWRPVNVYINGSFYGQLNMREPNNKHYAYANYGFDSEEIDQFEMSPDSGYVQMTGTRDAFDRLMDLSKQAANAATYEEIGALLDVDEFINYIALEVFLGNWDWPQNNVKGFRSIADGRFRFVVFDLDGSDFSKSIDEFMNTTTRWTDALRGEDAWGNALWGKSHEAELYMATLFNNLVKNSDFRRRFVDALCLLSGSTFHPDYARPIIDEMASQMNYWYNHPGDLIAKRYTDMPQQLARSSHSFGVTESGAVQVTMTADTEGAQLFANGLPVPTGRFDGRLYLPMTLKAVAPAGFTFKGWCNVSSDNDTSVKSTLFDKGAEWSYYDSGSLDGKSWTSGALESGWKTGATMIGYTSANDLPTQTTKNLPTYYFRKTITLTEAVATSDVFLLKYIVDDGFVVYVNGVEAGRYNMPSGAIAYDTPATSYAVNNPDEGQMQLLASLFRKGENVIAVEVHNNQPSSSDIMWNASLLLQQKEGDWVSTQPEYVLTGTQTKNLVACFEPMQAAELAESGTAPIRINEVSASNDIYINDWFKKDDWIELYNTTSEPIDIAGMYLSDNEAKPQKFQVPADEGLNTVIPPHGYLVVWASKRDDIGTDIHANFKLGNDDGAYVLLTAEDGTRMDSLAYVAHDSRTTVGAYPDGSNDVYLMQLPTIGKANLLTSYAQYLYTRTPGQGASGINSVTLDAEVLSVRFFTLDGICVGSDVQCLPKGIYIELKQMSDGRVVTRKVVAAP